MFILSAAATEQACSVPNQRRRSRGGIDLWGIEGARREQLGDRGEFGIILVGEPHYPFHDRTVVVTSCGRLCLYNKKINLSVSLAGQAVGVLKEFHEEGPG